MERLFFDTETHLVKPGMGAPRLVCVSTFDGERRGLWDRAHGLSILWGALSKPGLLIGGHHIFYDLGVIAAEDPRLLPLIFRKLDAGEITCTRIRQMMIDNATGNLKFVEDELGDLRTNDFSLQALVRRHLKKYISKGSDTWRLRYNELDGVPIALWPEEARQYAVEDAVYAHDVWMAQEALVAPEGIPGEAGQTQAGWALHLASIWGVRTDRDHVEQLRSALQADYDAEVVKAQAWGFVRADGSRDMSAICAAVAQACAYHGRDVPQTPSGRVSTDRETLVESGHPGLLAVSEVVRLGKVLSTYVPRLLEGTERPINPFYNTIVESFRTSCGKPNLQNPPRKGGVRECFVARPGYVFVFCDYDTLEMRTLAQNCIDLFGYSNLGDAIRAGLDPHLALGSDILKLDYEEARARYDAGDPVVADARQASKPANFGFPGGMAADSFRDYARKSYGIEISPELARELHAAFRRRWSEVVEYFRYCSALTGHAYCSMYKHPRTGLVRGQVHYTALCNHNFQHLAAIGAKDALYAVQRECFLGTTPEGEPSPLYGARAWLFLHDEIGLEVPYQDAVRASAAADRLREVMIQAMQRWVPDVPIAASPVMARRWYKGAKAVREGGILVPSKPSKIVEGDKERVVWVHDTDVRLAA